MYMCMYMYIYIYIYTSEGRDPGGDDPDSERARWGQHSWGHCESIVCVTEGLLGVVPLTHFCLQNKCQDESGRKQASALRWLLPAPQVIFEYNMHDSFN